MPKVVAIVGASVDRRKWGNRAVRAFVKAGYEVVPIHPRQSSVEGLTAYPSVLQVPGPIDMASVYVPAHVAERLLAEFLEKGIGEVWFNPGADDDRVVAEARRLGLKTIVACSILGAGEDPGEFRS